MSFSDALVITMPVVTSITPSNPGKAAASVVYTVQFDVVVSAVDLGDFELTTASGTAVGTITGVTDSGSGSNYLVTVSSITGDGSLRLDLKSSGTGIVDQASNPIVSGFTTGTAHAVDRVAPTVASIDRVDGATTGANGIGYTITFSEDVTGIDLSDLSLTTTGTANGSISSMTGSGSIYSLFVTGVTGDGTMRLDLNNANTNITDTAGNIIADGGYTSGQLYTLDHTAPSVSSVSPPPDSTYRESSSLDFTVNFNEAMTVTGTPRIGVTLDAGGTKYANYLSGSGSTSLVFRCTVQAGDADVNGVSLSNAIDLNGGGVKDAAGNNATLALNSVGALSGVLVDGSVPVINSVAVPGNGIYKALDQLSFTVNFSESVTVVGSPYLDLTVGSSAVQAQYASGSGTSLLQFSYVIASGSLDADGVALGASLALNGGSLKNGLGANAALTLNSVGNTAGVLVDAVAPAVSSVSLVAAATTNASSVDYTVVFSEAVTGVDTGDFTLSRTGLANGAVTGVTGSGNTYTLTVSSVTGDGTLRLDLNNTGTGIADTAGNAIAAGYTGGQFYTLDHTGPAVGSVSPPANGSYGVGQNLDFTVNFNEAVTVSTLGGTPRISVTIGSSNVEADYLSGSGSTSLVFRYTVVSGQVDSDGVSLGSSITLNGGTLVDGVGNDATLVLNNVGVLSGVLVDGVAPTVSSISRVAAATTNASSVDYTVVFSEVVTGVDMGDFTLNKTNSANGTITGIAGSGTTYTVSVTSLTGDGNLRLDLKGAGTNIVDGIGNAIATSGYTSGASYTLDHTSPAVVSVGVPVNARYAVSSDLNFTVNFNEAVTVDATGGTPRLAVTIDGPSTVYANYASGSGTTALVFRYTVGNGNADQDGVALAGAIDLHGGTLKDAAGNDVTLALNSVGVLSGVLVGAPVVVSPVEAPQRILLGASDDTAYGGGGNDTLIGGMGNDRLFGASGDDVLQGGRSDVGQWNFFLGANGRITARHQTAAADSVTTENVTASELNQAAPELNFLSANNTSLANVALLYEAAFGRKADLAGLSFWAASGLSPQALAQAFVGSAEWRAAGGDTLGDTALVQTLYRQKLGREPDDAGLKFWLGKLAGSAGEAPVSRATLLTGIALSDEGRSVSSSADGMSIGTAIVKTESSWLLGSGNDTLDGGAGNDTLIGGDGIDTVVYANSMDAYRIALSRDGKVLVIDKQNGDVDTLSGIERGSFNGVSVDLAFTQASQATLQRVGLLYQTVFDRAADASGFAFWANPSLSSAQLVAGFTQSSEYQARFGGTNDKQFVQALYANAGMQGTAAGGVGQWEGYLATHSRDQMLVAWLGDEAVASSQFANGSLWLV